MLSGDIARMQIADRIRDAEFDRRARSARRQDDVARATTRRMPRRSMRTALVGALGRH